MSLSPFVYPPLFVRNMFYCHAHLQRAKAPFHLEKVAMLGGSLCDLIGRLHTFLFFLLLFSPPIHSRNTLGFQPPITTLHPNPCLGHGSMRKIFWIVRRPIKDLTECKDVTIVCMCDILQFPQFGNWLMYWRRLGEVFLSPNGHRPGHIPQTESH